MISKLKLNFVDFWPDFQKDNNYFYHLLASEYDVSIDEKDPDLLFFSVDYAKTRERDKYKNHRCKKIFYTGESVSPNFDSDQSIEVSNFQAHYDIGKCDFSFSYDFSENCKNYRLPLWVMHIDWFNKKSYGDSSFLLPLDQIEDNEFIRKPKNKFCAFVFSNPTPLRVEIFNKLSKYKQVDGFGKPFNNWTSGELIKYKTISDYKFSICFENRRYAGYITEKPFHAKTAGNVPIYHADKSVFNDVNENCFINFNDFDSVDDLVNYIQEVDNDEGLYDKYANEPLFKDNKIKNEFTPNSVLKFFKETVL
tara:strand:+ start:72 stop:995 length:924 start_codon:yes stop_codon:yes gene_type:complete